MLTAGSRQWSFFSSFLSISIFLLPNIIEFVLSYSTQCTAERMNVCTYLALVCYQGILSGGRPSEPSDLHVQENSILSITFPFPLAVVFIVSKCDSSSLCCMFCESKNYLFYLLVTWSPPLPVMPRLQQEGFLCSDVVHEAFKLSMLLTCSGLFSMTGMDEASYFIVVLEVC